MNAQYWDICESALDMLEYILATGAYKHLGGGAKKLISDRKLKLFCAACRNLFYSKDSPLNLDHKARAVYDDEQIGPARAAILWASSLSGSRQYYKVTLPNYLRDLVGNPFIPLNYFFMQDSGIIYPSSPVGSQIATVLDPVSWCTEEVKRLAQAVYMETEGDYLNSTSLSVLADALEEAGCLDQYIITHLRSKSVHIPGCYVLDFLLTRG